MPTGCKKFVPVVQGCPFWSEHDEIFLFQAEHALLGCGVKTLATGDQLPGYFVGDVGSFEPPYMFA